MDGSMITPTTHCLCGGQRYQHVHVTINPQSHTHTQSPAGPWCSTAVMDGPLQACGGTGLCVAVSVQIKAALLPESLPNTLTEGEDTQRAHRGSPGFVSVTFDSRSPSIMSQKQRKRRVACHQSSLQERRTCARCRPSPPSSLHLLPHSHFTFTRSLSSVTSASRLWVEMLRKTVLH